MPAPKKNPEDPSRTSFTARLFSVFVGRKTLLNGEKVPLDEAAIPEDNDQRVLMATKLFLYASYLAQKLEEFNSDEARAVVEQLEYEQNLLFRIRQERNLLVQVGFEPIPALMIASRRLKNFLVFEAETRFAADILVTLKVDHLRFDTSKAFRIKIEKSDISDKERDEQFKQATKHLEKLRRDEYAKNDGGYFSKLREIREERDSYWERIKLILKDHKFSESELDKTVEGIQLFLKHELNITPEDARLSAPAIAKYRQMAATVYGNWPPPPFLIKGSDAPPARLKYYLNHLLPLAKVGWLNAQRIQEEFGKSFQSLLDRSLKDKKLVKATLPEQFWECDTTAELIAQSGGQKLREKTIADLGFVERPLAERESEVELFKIAKGAPGARRKTTEKSPTIQLYGELEAAAPPRKG